MANVNTAEDGKLQYEAGQDFTDYTALTDDGDNTTFTSTATLWSGRSGYDVTVRPNGIVTGGVVSAAASGSNDVVDITALTCYLSGTLTSLNASTDFSITRGTGSGYKICSITVNSGGSFEEVEGAEHTAFSSTRGANGGPPWIPTTSIEVAQVRMTSTTNAAITASEIKQVVGTHRETYNHPVWEVDYYNAQVEFVSAMDAIHSDDAGSNTATKKVYVSYYEPTFATQPYANDFNPPENSHSVNSTQVYGTTIGSTSSTVGQGSFTAYLSDGVTDNIISFKDDKLWFKFYPDRNKSPYILCQGKLGIERQYPTGDNINASCTISPSEAAHGVSS